MDWWRYCTEGIALLRIYQDWTEEEYADRTASVLKACWVSTWQKLHIWLQWCGKARISLTAYAMWVIGANAMCSRHLVRYWSIRANSVLGAENKSDECRRASHKRRIFLACAFEQRVLPLAKHQSKHRQSLPNMSPCRSSWSVVAEP